MRRTLLIVGLLAALAVPAAATAAKPPVHDVICDASCIGGTGGWTGCTSQSASESLGIRFVSWWRHYLVVNYCKVNGWITSASITAHGCDYEGVMFCSVGPAWLTSGGVGYGYASFTGHGEYLGALGGVPFAGGTTVNVNIPLG